MGQPLLTDPSSFADLLQKWSQVGFPGALAIAVLAFFRGWIVPGKTHEREMDRVRTERDEWKAMCTDAVRASVNTSELLKQALRSSR